MAPDYRCMLETDGRPLEVAFSAEDDNAARFEALLSASDVLRDCALRGRRPQRLLVRACDLDDRNIFEVRIYIDYTPAPRAPQGASRGDHA